MEPVKYEDILAANQPLVITVKGISMLPLLRQRKDVVVIEKKPYKMHDVVLFRRTEKGGKISYVLHRIVEEYNDDAYLIWGDNTYNGDVVKPEEILGVMTSFIREGKTTKVTDLKYRMYVKCYCAPYKIRVAIKKSICMRVIRKLRRIVTKR